MTKRPIEAVRRTRMMRRRGFRVCEISRMLGIPHQTVSDWISGRRRPGGELFKRSEHPMPPEFSGRCPDCGRRMVRVLEHRGPQPAGHRFYSFWRCGGCGLNVKTSGDEVASAWLAED